MKTIISILCFTLLMAACSTTDTVTDDVTNTPEVQTETEPNSMKRPADMQGNIIEGGVNISGGDTTIRETDGHKITVTHDDGDTTITPLPDVDTDTTDNIPPRNK